MEVSVERDGENSSVCPIFIKVLSSESLIMLVVPRQFVKHLDESALKTVTLVTPRGKFWHIQVLLNLDDELDVQFGRGWELFVQFYSLKPGKIVLFRYEGNTVFSVEIFHSDGSCCSCYYDCNELDATPRRLAQDQAVKNESSKQPTETENNNKRMKKPENTGVEEPKVYRKRLIRNKGEQLSRFEWILRSYNVDLSKAQIYLPQRLVRAEKSEMISLDCLGRLWPVRLWVGLNEQIAISTGWKQLVRETKLREGDKCIFETISQGVLGLKIERKT